MADVVAPPASHPAADFPAPTPAPHPHSDGNESHDTAKKHPLENAWTIWFDNTQKTKQSSWGSALRSVYTFSTVEDFWCLFNNVVEPSRLIQGTDFHCFKEGISPQWEDPKCSNGGKWTAVCNRRKDIDTYWLHTLCYVGHLNLCYLDELLALIGEQFVEGDEICGVVVSIRARQDRISLWTRTASNEAAQMSIAKQWKDFLNISENIGFIAHEDAKKQGKVNARYSA